MIAVIFGIQGVGKSTLVTEVLKDKPRFKRLYWGEYAFKLALEQKLVKTKDEIRELPVTVQKKLQKDVGKHLAEIIKKNHSADYVIETHAALKTRQGYMPGLTPQILDLIMPDIFIVIESDAKDIYHRRILDETRKREHDKTIKDIQLNLDTTRLFAADFSTHTGANLMFVENVEDNLDIAVDNVVKALELYN